jgi:hypothetical protein
MIRIGDNEAAGMPMRRRNRRDRSSDRAMPPSPGPLPQEERDEVSSREKETPYNELGRIIS